jgi:hypothetical protein
MVMIIINQDLIDILLIICMFNVILMLYIVYLDIMLFFLSYWIYLWIWLIIIY